MEHELFYRFGKLIYKLRWPIIVLWIVLIGCCIPIAPHVVTSFKSTGFIADNSPSAKAENYLNQQFGFNNNKLIIIYSSNKLETSNPQFMHEVKNSLVGLKNFPLQHDIIYPKNNKQQISKDKHTAYAVVLIQHEQPLSHDQLLQFKALIQTPPDMTIQIGGEPVFVESVNKQTQLDLFKADFVAGPITIITMIIIFESIVGAIVPIIVGAGCALMILTILYVLGQYFTLSIFTLNIALLLGLCLSLDYALFIISRFRYELRNGRSPLEAIAVTQATAGKAVFFSGLAVFVSLSALLLFPINILFSVGMGGISSVFVAVITANVLLPSILAILNKRINILSIKLLTPLENGRSPFWHWLVTKVVHRPSLFFIAIFIVLLALSYPLLNIKFGISDYRILPPHSVSREFFNEYNANFGESSLTPIQLIVETNNNILSKTNINELYELAKQLKNNPAIKEIDSIVTTAPALTQAGYYALYNTPKYLMNANIATLLATTTREHVTVLTIVSKFPVNAVATKNLVAELQQLKLGAGMSVQVAGTSAKNIDVINSIKSVYLYAIVWIMVFTYLILIVLLRSLILPIKAILMTMLSLCASYGVLVFIIQEGYFSQYLNFQPQGMLDISLLIIIFCALFGFSMDYEVFLLSRIKEHYDETNHPIKSIVFGVENSSRIITSAAMIVIFISGSFMVADVLMVKAFGLGIAIAIFTDAFLIRSLLVPAAMAIIKKWSWYLPNWLAKIIPKI